MIRHILSTKFLTSTIKSSFKPASVPVLLSGLILNKSLKKHINIARCFEQRYYMRISDDTDVEELKKNYLKKLEDADNIHLDIRDSKIDSKSFGEVFEVLSKQTDNAVKKEELHLDLTNTKIDDEKVEAMSKCFKKLDLKRLSLHVSNVELTNKQFDHLIDSIEANKNLSILNLEMENVNLNRTKRNKLESLVYSLKNLSNVTINIRNNNLRDEDVSALDNVLRRFEIRQFFF